MTLLYVDRAIYLRLKAQDADDYDGPIEDPIYMWMRIRWFEEHGPGFFLSHCCGQCAIPAGLIPGPDADEIARQNAS